MNLGSIKDKTSKTILKKRSIKKAAGLLAVCCVAVIAVTATVSLTSSPKEEQTPVLSAVKPTESVKTNGKTTVNTPNYVISNTPAPTLAPMPTDAPASSGATVVSTSMILPITNGNVLKGYAEESLVYSQTLDHWATHTALDISAPSGTLVLCALDGTVSNVVEDALMGLTVTVAHESGIETVYSSLDTITDDIKEGSVLLKGQAIGTVGNSASSESSDGVHLHFEVKKNGKTVNPQNYLSGFGK